MVVAIEPATFASLRATRASLLPLVVKHCFANSIEFVLLRSFFCADAVQDSIFNWASLPFFVSAGASDCRTLGWNWLWLFDDR